MTARIVLAIALLFCVSLVAEERPKQTVLDNKKPLSTGNPAEDQDNLFIKLSDKPQVDASRAMSCPVCKKPYYLHSEENFVCEPPDREVQRIQWANLKSPITGRNLKIALPGNINEGVGTDYDLCRHSIGKVAVHSNVFIDPDTGYAAPDRLWNKELDGSSLKPETIAFVKEKLEKDTISFMLEVSGVIEKPNLPPEILQFSSYVDSTSIPDWFKYENALKIILHSSKLLGTKPPHSLMTKMHLEAAWANRRFVCSEIAVNGLYQELNVTLGRSIRLMSQYVQAESVQIRQERGQNFVNPLEPETDPAIQELATARIIKKGQELVKREVTDEVTGPRVIETARFNSGDIYVLYIMRAGFLDRLGRINEAMQALKEARDMFNAPESAHGLEEKKARDFLFKQVELLHKVVDQRMACLKRERDHLYLGADRLMQMLYFHNEPDKSNDARDSYLIGELLRRDGRELSASMLWLKIGKLLLARSEAGKELPEPVRQQLMTWSAESILEVGDQLKRINASKIEENMMLAASTVLKRQKTDLSADAVLELPLSSLTRPNKLGERVERKPQAEPLVHVKPIQKGEGAPGGTSRQSLLMLYYGALQRYFEDKKENPADLSILVSSGFLKPEFANLDAKGKLICPESGAVLMYLSRTKLGDATLPIVMPLYNDMNKTALYGDGTIKAIQP